MKMKWINNVINFLRYIVSPSSKGPIVIVPAIPKHTLGIKLKDGDYFTLHSTDLLVLHYVVTEFVSGDAKTVSWHPNVEGGEGYKFTRYLNKTDIQSMILGEKLNDPKGINHG